MSTGTTMQVIGAVVDVEFPAGQIPKIYDALIIDDAELTLEVQQQLGDGVVRTIAMGSSEGLKRGMAVTDTGSPITVPVGEKTLGRIMDVLGRPIDNAGEIGAETKMPIHRPPPSYEEQAATTEPAQISEAVLDDGARCYIFMGDDFVAVHALVLNRYPRCIGRHGALVGIPSRNVLVAGPIDDLSVVSAVRGMIPVIRAAEEEGPGSITTNLYWYLDGSFTNLPYILDENELKFGPPEAFLELLNRLRESDVPADDKPVTDLE